MGPVEIKKYTQNFKILISIFWPLDGLKKIFQCDFRNLWGRIRGIKYKNGENLQNHQNRLVHGQP